MTDTDWLEEIVWIRRVSGMSQTELGKALRVSACTVSRWERGRQRPYLGMMRRLRAMEHDSKVLDLYDDVQELTALVRALGAEESAS